MIKTAAFLAFLLAALPAARFEQRKKMQKCMRAEGFAKATES